MEKVKVWATVLRCATAVAIGRPYIRGLASFGQEGVEMVLDILRRELLFAMRQAGARSIAEIDRSYVVDNGQWREAVVFR